MKTAEEILKSKLDGKITFVNNPDYTFNKVIEAMEEYRLQSHPSPMSASDMTARDYFDGEGSPLTLSKICSDEEKEFLLQHIELYASGKVHQSKQPPMSAEQRTNAMDVLKKHLKVDWIFSGDSGKAIIDAMEEWKRTPVITDAEQKYIDAVKNKSCAICGYFCNNVHHYNNWYDVSPESPMSAEQVEELGYYYPLFKFFSDEHGLSLLDSQLQDVIHECKKFIEPAPPKQQ
jgi:hypothetical protein